jgi:predicted DNA-binding transcriptional regulator YafY
MPYTGTHERTVYRDLSDLSAAGIPIERDKVRGTFQLKKRDFMRWLEKRDQKSTDEA